MRHYDYNSSKNLAIKDRFVQREVIACISDMAEYLFGYDGDKYADWDEWENLYVTRCPECGEIVVEWVEADGNDVVEWAEVDENDVASEHTGHGVKCPHCGAIHEEEPEAEPQEIYEYWIVTPWLGKKLRDKGEPVLERSGGWIWGRTCTGQAILLDWVIHAICSDLGLLE
jgi:predicted RNA-binding Zn-ribbon protein involved in translation (DUF1610 family)